MAYIPRWYVSHRRRVQMLYKKILRDVEDWNFYYTDTVIQKALVREQFEKNRNIRDPLKARKAMEAAELHFKYICFPEPFRFPTSYEGTAWERDEMEQNRYDIVLDYWHPLEKAQYPDYFAKREQRKKEFVEWYDKKYGKPPQQEY